MPPLAYGGYGYALRRQNGPGETQHVRRQRIVGDVIGKTHLAERPVAGAGVIHQMADIRPGLQGVTATDDGYVVHELKGPAEIQAVTAHVAVSHAHKTLNVDHRETRFNLRNRSAIRTVHLKPVN